MIIKGLLNLIYNVFYILTLPINIPNLPNSVVTYVNTALEYIGTGIGVLSNYTHLSYLLTLFGVVVAIDLGLWLYKIVMYIIKKIPMLNVN